MDLRQHIDQSGERQAVWADRIGISRAYLSDLLARKKLPSLRLAARIERLTGNAVGASSWVPDDGAPVTDETESAV
ncbi:helix-turn-helix domain-containing protein [Gemmobacter nectariphilus]|uniref:helix-turn-helix domain-containing protein n=1 Tax=Gemmobacter nectariphilus TaxID=220343 RepID=UPI0003F97C19|nr:helix-turn-helix transcriptional regulator [Gemmobacter nectariphilus]